MRLLRQGENRNSLYLRGLSHGVSMHHAGLNNVYRSAVEMLFRMRVLNVVYATTTLALGEYSKFVYNYLPK